MVRRKKVKVVASNVKKVKYSNETYSINKTVQQSAAGSTQNVVMIASIDNQGMRKAKNFSLKIYTPNMQSGDNAAEGGLVWALVFVPEGTNVQNMQLGSDTSSSLYEPNQNVIMSGIACSNQITNAKTRLARNMNAGDAIYLVFQSYNNAVAYSVGAVLNYAIAY